MSVDQATRSEAAIGESSTISVQQIPSAESNGQDTSALSRSPPDGDEDSQQQQHLPRPVFLDVGDVSLGTGSLIASRGLDEDLYRPPEGIVAMSGAVDAGASGSGGRRGAAAAFAAGQQQGLNGAMGPWKRHTSDAESLAQRFPAAAPPGTSRKQRLMQALNTRLGGGSTSGNEDDVVTRDRAGRAGKGKENGDTITKPGFPTISTRDGEFTNRGLLAGKSWRPDDLQQPPKRLAHRKAARGVDSRKRNTGNTKGIGGVPQSAQGGVLHGIGPAGIGVSSGIGGAGMRRKRFSSLTSSNGSAQAAREAGISNYSTFGGGRTADRKQKHWTYNLFRPSHETVEIWLDSWWKRWAILAVAPSMIVWFWCAFPFPKSDPYDPSGPWCQGANPPPWCSVDGGHGQAGKLPSATTMKDSKAVSVVRHMPSLSYFLYNTFISPSSKSGAQHDAPVPPPANEVDANFWFFLIFYYGIYCAVALIYITQLFSLYRLNWWPKAFGARTSYAAFWVGSLFVGWVMHELDPLGTEDRRRQHAGEGGHHHHHHGGSLPGENPHNGTTTPPAHGSDPWDGDLADEVQWQRKTMWVGLAFATMAMPALVCLAGLRRSGRQTYRHSLTDLQKTFLERQLARRIPSSYIRFLWFMLVIGLALFALIAGQGYASVYLSTLPHTGIDGTAYVTFWALTVNVLAIASHWMLEEKIRSRALVFVFKYYYFLVYFIFYRNLFARLRSFDQFALIQLLSSFWVCIWYPFSMTSFSHRLVEYFNPQPKSWEEYVEGVGLAFYLRNLAQNATMLAFLGWVSILHFGPNQQLYPFFAFDDKRDPYNYQLTMLGASAIWGSELLSSYVAREMCKYSFGVDVTNLGLDEMRQYPEIVPTCLWTSVHVLMDMLLFLIKLNFR